MMHGMSIVEPGVVKKAMYSEGATQKALPGGPHQFPSTLLRNKVEAPGDSIFKQYKD
jgi:hypothetical protein